MKVSKLNNSVKVAALAVLALTSAQGMADSELPSTAELVQTQCRVAGREAKTVYIGNVRQERYWNLDQALEAITDLQADGECQVLATLSPDCEVVDDGGLIQLYLKDTQELYAAPDSPLEPADGYVQSYSTLDAALLDVEKLAAAGLCNYPW